MGVALNYIAAIFAAAGAFISQRGSAVMRQGAGANSTALTAAGYSMVEQKPFDNAYTSVRLTLHNYSASPIVLTAVKIASAPTDLHNGVGLTWIQATASGSTTITIPAMTQGAGGTAANNRIPGLVVLDSIAISSVARTDTPGDPFLLQLRAYGAGSISVSGGNITRSNNSATDLFGYGYRYGFNQVAGDVVTTIASFAPQSFAALGLIGHVAYTTGNTNHYMLPIFGDSLTAGYSGTSDSSQVGWPNILDRLMRAKGLIGGCANWAVGGMTLENFIATAKAVVGSMPVLPRAIFLSCYSPNDGTSTQAGWDTQLATGLAGIDYFTALGIKVYTSNAMPLNALTTAQNGYRNVFNTNLVAALASRPNVTMWDFNSVIEDPSNLGQQLASVYYDGTHPNPAGNLLQANLVAASILALSGVIDSVMFATAGRQGGINSSTAQSTQQYATDRTQYQSPPYAVTAPQLIFAGFYVDQNSTIEHALGNDVLIQGVTLEIAGAIVATFKVGGSTSWNLPNGTSVITDADNTVVIPPNTTFALRVATNVATGALRPMAARTNLALSLDGTKQGSTDQSSALTGSPTWAVVRQTPQCGPAFIVGKGWAAAGKPPIPWVVGDSIAAGNNDSYWFQPTDGLYGYINHALTDNSTSPRYAFANSAIPGVSYSAFSAANFTMRQALFNLLPNFPATSIISEMGTNAGGGAAAVSGWPAYGAFLKTLSGGKRIVQTTMMPKSTATSSSLGWSTAANQVKVDFSPYNTFIRAKGDANMDDFIDIGGVFENTLDGGLWPPGAYSGLVSTDFVSGTTTLIVDTQPTVGDWLFVGSGTGLGGALAGSSCLVQSYTGTGPYTILLQQTATGTAVAGTTVKSVTSIDGVHPLTLASSSTAGKAPVIAAKNAGKIV